MSHPYKEEIERGRKNRLDHDFSLGRYWQKGYRVDRFSPGYLKDCYSNAPEAVFKVISFGRGKSQLKNLLEYVTKREGKDVEFYSESGEALYGAEDLQDTLDRWSSEFRKKGSGRGAQRHFTHIILSADVENTTKNSNKVLLAAEQTCKEEFAKAGFEYHMILHTDTENPHVHVVVNNYNTLGKNKLRLDKYDFMRIRSEFAKDLTNEGLRKHVATLRRDRPHILHNIEEQISKFQVLHKHLRTDYLDQCELLKRKTQLNAQLTKQAPQQYDFSNAALSFAKVGNDNLIVKTNKQGVAFEKTLKKICIEMESRKNGIFIDNDGNVNAIIKDKGSSIELQELIEFRFHELIQKKDYIQQKRNDELIIRKTKDLLPRYQNISRRTNKLIKYTKRSTLLSWKQKEEKIAELRKFRSKLIDGYNVDELYKASALVKVREREFIFKELANRTKEKGFFNRKRGLERTLYKQQNDIKLLIKHFKEKKKDKKMVTLLEGVISKKSYQAIMKSSDRVKKNILEL